MRRRFMFILAFLLLSGVAASRARDYGWTAWLHYGRHMTLVNAAGESLREVELPLADGYELKEAKVAVSPSGRFVAYLATADQQHAQVMIYDTESGTLTLQYPIELNGDLWGTSWFEANPQMFNDIESAFVFGYTSVDRDTQTADWHLIALDLLNSQPIGQLGRDLLLQRGLSDPRTWTPLIRRYRAGEITFILDILENEGDPNSFTWNVTSGQIRDDVAFPGLRSDFFLPTGEVVSPMYGSFAIPVPESGSKGLPHTLQVYDPIIGGRYPFYQSADLLPEQVYFVQNATYVLVQTAEIWMLVGRDGAIADQRVLPPDMEITSLKGIPQGFLYATSLLSGALTLPALLAVNTQDGKLNMGQILWKLSFEAYQQRAGERNTPLEIAWVHSDAPVGPFMPWAQLAAPVYQPTPQLSENTPQPTLIPTPEPLFQVGMVVKVQTTGGEILNLRPSPTRDAKVIMYLEDDMQLTLLEGPLDAEGFVWWRVRTADGVEGWAVANNGDLQTLVPE